MTELKIPTGRRWSVGLFTTIAEELNSELSDQDVTWIRATGIRVQRAYRSTKLPTSRGGVGSEKNRGDWGREENGSLFPSRFSLSLPPPPPPIPLPFCPCRAGYNCLNLCDIVPPMNSLLLLSRTGFINRSVVAQLLSILWSPLFLKRLYIQWSIQCPVNHPNKKKLLLHCMDSLMPRSCQCSLPISRYVLHFLLWQGSKIFSNNR